MAAAQNSTPDIILLLWHWSNGGSGGGADSSVPRFRDVGTRGPATCRRRPRRGVVRFVGLLPCRVTADRRQKPRRRLASAADADISGCCHRPTGKKVTVCRISSISFLICQGLCRYRYRDHVTAVLYVIANIRVVLVRSFDFVSFVISQQTTRKDYPLIRYSSSDRHA